MQHADTTTTERIRHPLTEEEKERIYYSMIGSGIAACIRRFGGRLGDWPKAYKVHCCIIPLRWCCIL